MDRGTAALLLALLVPALGLPGCRSGGATAGASGARPLPRPLRAVWVARFHYQTADDIRAIMRNCAADGFNTVLWQVRGNGSVLYPSRIEPWAGEFEHRDPGFDPLALAVREAHANGLRIEAWVNVMPGWRGPEPPPIRGQLWHTHPEWFLRDAGGRRQPLGDFYAILNPCLPQVRDYICAVIGEIVARYDVDGVHLDYVRYAWETTKNARHRYPRDPQTLRLYRRETGKHPDDDRGAWDAWRANQLTRLVEQIHGTIRRRRATAALTAAVVADPQRGYREYFQNAVGWLRAGLLDAAYIMAYSRELDRFEAGVGAYQALAPGARIVPGVGVYKHEDPSQTARQLERCRLWGGGFAVFSYASLHATAADRGTRRATLREENERREERRGIVRGFTR